MRRVLAFFAFPAAALVLLGAPGWLMIWNHARGWDHADIVTVTIAPNVECRTGPPPELSKTCPGTWTWDGVTVEGDVSNRYGGARPTPGTTLEARRVTDGLAVVAFRPWLYDYAVATPWLTLGGIALFALTLPTLPGRSWEGRGGEGLEADLPTPTPTPDPEVS